MFVAQRKKMFNCSLHNKKFGFFCGAQKRQVQKKQTEFDTMDMYYDNDLLDQQEKFQSSFPPPPPFYKDFLYFDASSTVPTGSTSIVDTNNNNNNNTTTQQQQQFFCWTPPQPPSDEEFFRMFGHVHTVRLSLFFVLQKYHIYVNIITLLNSWKRNLSYQQNTIPRI